MEQLTGRLRSEHKTLVCMTKIYCEDHHGQHPGGLCGECAALMEYSAKRLAKCPYGEDKPTCANCPIHCYKPARKAQAREIMRYAGPRMLLRHPLLAIAHQLDGFRKARHPRALTREQRLRSRKE
ncbi:MAG: nitrous oxide-stimulated promoter family protein [Xanthomonadales bacterium]|nr:nitrous oxide-stimulated promoter family protein [Gammaproteobacteria bacterium]NNK05216.1 nitrous oxide-stimulated promoter family protein [Xanthomonadales bacterium]